MASITTAARELAELCDDLHKLTSAKAGMDALKEHFKIESNSDFHEILSVVFSRVAQAEMQINSVEEDEYISGPAKLALTTLNAALSPQSMSKPWDNLGRQQLIPDKISALRSFSGQLKHNYPLPKLSEEERKNLLTEAENLKAFVELQQMTDHEIYRALMLAGLNTFCKRLRYLNWLGAEYTFESLRGILGATIALQETATSDEGAVSIVDAVQKFYVKFRTVIHGVKDVVVTGKLLYEGFEEINKFMHSDIVSQAPKLLQDLRHITDSVSS
ncbi:hypothetical protein [Asticcacaulis taihuensis]|uniref:hypothetical protein n=1 Tax=Asticcacaulis taihuensis TaxID=260084 RepID=UPI0026F3498E|nr:hypothetical protein [Asticcacaulis taihuensis]